MNVPAKISRPRLSAVVQRARLLELLEASREAGSATFISGPPGSGKTTLTSSYIELRNLRCIWYQVDQGDEDLPTFFHFLTRAAQSVTADRTVLLPQYDGQTSLIRFSQVFFRQLYDGLRTPFVIVFDGY